MLMMVDEESLAIHEINLSTSNSRTFYGHFPCIVGLEQVFRSCFEVIRLIFSLNKELRYAVSVVRLAFCLRTLSHVSHVR